MGLSGSVAQEGPRPSGFAVPHYRAARCGCMPTSPQDPAGAPQAPTTVAEAEVLGALARIIDPDFGEDIVSCGFVRDLVADIDGGRASFRLQLTTPACPVKAEFERLVRHPLLPLTLLPSLLVAGWRAERIVPLRCSRCHHCPATAAAAPRCLRSPPTRRPFTFPA